jgi:hypothetical protein
MRDRAGVRGGWREGLNNGGVPLAALTLLVVLPLGAAALRRIGSK